MSDVFSVVVVWGCGALTTSCHTHDTGASGFSTRRGFRLIKQTRTIFVFSFPSIFINLFRCNMLYTVQLFGRWEEGGILYLYEESPWEPALRWMHVSG